ncbi:hypothetical protein [Mucilaginibacter ginsenosidivorans]|uniref:Uncharacterized protein n=1 Tax=Mucilaginibacter ginsenosidivorans TaxID=398053 RepID=A0A5B8UWJ4_9SPHI|nr:hypothetical protein [Mucilaginibacter ginsenosidivorans]QEC63333.1 hypothetical protein FRZ54_12360 [Mucilaginibacter ginsenosidivorans]
MKKLLILLLQIPFLACSQHKPNPEAIKLNDSAVELMMASPVISNEDSSILNEINIQAKQRGERRHSRNKLKDTVINDESQYKKAIDLLNKATQIDGDYFIAYLNKMGAQTHLKLYKDALTSGKEMTRLLPNDGTVTQIVGMTYERSGDTLTAMKYYNIALTQLDRALASMSINNKHYNNIKATKAEDLVMLNRIPEAQKILQELYNTADENRKELYKDQMTWTRNDFLNGSKSEGALTEPAKK